VVSVAVETGGAEIRQAKVSDGERKQPALRTGRQGIRRCKTGGGFIRIQLGDDEAAQAAIPAWRRRELNHFCTARETTVVLRLTKGVEVTSRLKTARIELPDAAHRDGAAR